MKFYADLHVHSRYSIATGKNATLEWYYYWARVKGISIIATGDFTHPQWFGEINEKLKEDGRGFLVFKEEPAFEGEAETWLQGTREIGVRFCLSSEISSIYSEGGKTYRIHSLIYAPTIEVAERIRRKLEDVGNLSSDGRPILKLSPVEILRIVRETSEDAYLIPAHVWTPWFSLFGARSGYDSFEVAFRGYEDEIFALETGLSSDPAMNRLLSSLDRFTLVSNSDAHSPSKIGREANIFDSDVSYYEMFDAMKKHNNSSKMKGSAGTFIGTIEIFPEMGKYHFDGHRSCNVSLSPEEAERAGGRCPVCGRSLTMGVLHRVKELADRDTPLSREGTAGFVRRLPLVTLISLVEGRGENTKGVRIKYESFISFFGNEFDILNEVDLRDIERNFGEVYAKLIGKMRKEELKVVPGYDGIYGKIRNM